MRFFVLLALLFAFVSPSWSSVKNTKKSSKKSPPSLEEVKAGVKARAALLVDTETNEIIFSKNITSPYLPASTVKLMTALLVYEKTKLKGSLIVSRGATKVEPSHIPLRTGERVSVSDMVHTLLIGSDNDSAMALAYKAAGSEAKFVDMMNKRAKELGCTNTVFANPHGLPDAKQQFTTARDLLKIFQKVLQIPELRKIMKTKYFHLRTRVGSQRVKNHNKLLGKYSGMGPAKTGWTIASKHTYAASATRNNRELHLILLKSPNKWKDARLLFDYGFSHLPKKTKKVSSKKKEVKPVKTVKKETKIEKKTEEFPPKKKGESILIYKVRSGDTLFDLARKYNSTIEDIVRCSNIRNPDKLKLGQELKIPIKNER